MPPDPRRRRYPWFSDPNRWDYEDWPDEPDYDEPGGGGLEDRYMRERYIQPPRNRREMEVQRALRMIHKIRDLYDPLIDVIEYSESIVVAAELHGVRTYNIAVKIVDRSLTIGFKRGETRNIRVLKLPKPVDPKPIRSIHKNGILFLELRKSEHPVDAAVIPITSSE
ncbi:MAG: Hsp20/alpha crystallin family protein [Candidatus Bathyarchaeia archaeon]|nr:Hsp20/alpha crystallin family protein [Candidatus Bathyarchaeota archaeon]